MNNKNNNNINQEPFNLKKIRIWKMKGIIK